MLCAEGRSGKKKFSDVFLNPVVFFPLSTKPTV